MCLHHAFAKPQNFGLIPFHLTPKSVRAFGKLHNLLKACPAFRHRWLNLAGGDVLSGFLWALSELTTSLNTHTKLRDPLPLCDEAMVGLNPVLLSSNTWTSTLSITTEPWKKKDKSAIPLPHITSSSGAFKAGAAFAGFLQKPRQVWKSLWMSLLCAILFTVHFYSHIWMTSNFLKDSSLQIVYYVIVARLNFYPGFLNNFTPYSGKKIYPHSLSFAIAVSAFYFICAFYYWIAYLNIARLPGFVFRINPDIFPVSVEWPFLSHSIRMHEWWGRACSEHPIWKGLALPAFRCHNIWGRV